MKKFILIFIAFSYMHPFAQQKDDYKIKLSVGSELRIPILHHVGDVLNPRHYFGNNTDIYENMNGFPIYYALDLRLSKKWFVSFQHSIRYDHIAFKEISNYGEAQVSIAPNISAFFSDYKFSFHRYFTINKREKIDVDLGYSLMNQAGLIMVTNGMFGHQRGFTFTSFHLETNYHYKFLQLGAGVGLAPY